MQCKISERLRGSGLKKKTFFGRKVKLIFQFTPIKIQNPPQNIKNHIQMRITHSPLPAQLHSGRGARVIFSPEIQVF